MISYTKKYKGTCPHCENVIEYHTLTFTAVNDNGEMLCNCQNCKKKFCIPCMNPDESYIVSGANKLDYLDYEVDPPSRNPEIIKKFKFKGDIFKDKPSFDYNAYQLYCCDTCDENLEEIAHTEFSNKFDDWSKELGSYTSADISGYGYEPEKSLVMIRFSCSCKKKHNALFYKDFNHYGFNSKEFLLANISNVTKLNDKIDGLLSKTESLELLKKIIIRWELLFDKMYLIFPYVGYIRSSNEKILDLWKEIISQTNSNKLNIVTKTQTLNLYKKAVSESIMEYEELKKFGFTPDVISSAIKNSNSHAKIYCGVSENYVECISGSANIAKGPSAEQLTFREYNSYKTFFARYLSSFNRKEIPENLFPLPKDQIKHNCHVLFDQSNNFKAIRLYKTDLADLLK